MAVTRDQKSVLPSRLDWLSLPIGHEQRQTHWLFQVPAVLVQEVRECEPIS